ncbi:MAG: RnfABCDGE type electron transport complex subunit D [Oscillospiraceae bacterium]|nr:RnfABCDGE type electron transport complex subunit D [Oscillospiraceae bacterium]MDD4413471.1 RnfABCDGE type electron transport complex subunit D [Oscillospiraceae bacterium]
MTYKTARAPHLRRAERASMMCVDVLIALVPLCIFSSVYYGLRPVLLVLTGIISAIISETLCCLFMRRKPSVSDGTTAVTGALVGALVSPLSPYWLPAAGAIFAIVAVKMPMGGSGRNLFNPAAAGMAAITLCFQGFLFTYPDPGLGIPLPLADNALSGIITQSSPAAQLAEGGRTLYDPAILLLGDFPGPIGATAISILLAIAVYLYIRRAVSAMIILPYLATCAVLAAVFPRASGGSWLSIMMELCSGYLLFAGVFLLNDPVTAPRHWLGRVFYGILAGLFVMLMRYFGRFEEGVCFAILLANAFSTTLDRFGWYLLNLKRIRGRRRVA